MVLLVAAAALLMTTLAVVALSILLLQRLVNVWNVVNLNVVDVVDFFMMPTTSNSSMIHLNITRNSFPAAGAAV